MLSQGMAFSVSPLVVEWLETFNQGQAKTGWVGAANICVMFLTGKWCLSIFLLTSPTLSTVCALRTCINIGCVQLVTGH